MDINNLWSDYDLNSKKQNSRCLSVNTILEGKYLVGPVLGQGGFGITYVGYDLNMETKVAIKEYFPVELVSRDTTTMHGDRVLSLSGEKSVTYKAGLKKYVTEAQNVSQFSDIPGVVSVKDFFYANETAYIVMEFIDGISLKDYLKEKGGRLTEEETLKIMKPVLEALVQVHKSGIIHRDISPDNIMLTFEDGAGDAKTAGAAGSSQSGIICGMGDRGKIKSVKLIDFGAARMTEKNDQKSLTIILKHGYAPEEQYRTHGEQGPWTDVYALCAVLYRMMTGETPVPAMDRMFKDELKSFEQCNVNISANTANAILIGLAVKKDDRIQSVQELIGALYAGAKVKTTKTIAAGKSNKKGPLLAGVGALVAVMIAAAAFGIGGAGKKVPESVTVVAETTAASSTAVAAKEETVSETTTAAQTDAPEEMVMLEIADVTVEDVLGEQIVEWIPQTSISAKQQGHTLVCRQDGTVTAVGDNEYGQCMVQEWENIAAVSAGRGHSLGLRLDGKVYAVGNNENSQCEVENWEDIIAITAGNFTSYGLKKDGTIVATGRAAGMNDFIEKLNDVKAITTIYDYLVALDSDGVVHFSSDVFLDEGELPEITGWDDVAYLSWGEMNGMSLLGLTENGSVRRAEVKSSEYEHFETVENWQNIQQISTLTPVVAVNENGRVVCKDNINIDSVNHEEMKKVVSTWTDMLSVTSVFNFSKIHIIGLKQDGTIIDYRQNVGNSSPETMENLEWIRFIGSDETGLVAKTKDEKFLSYGLSNLMRAQDGALEYAYGRAEEVSDVVGLRASLNKKRQLVTKDGVPGYETYEEEDGLLQAIELWGGSYTMYPTYGYALLKKDHTVEIKVYEEGTTPTTIAPYEEYQEAVQAEAWKNVVQIVATDRGEIYGLHEDGTVSTTVEANQGKLQSVQGITKIALNGNLLLGIREDRTVSVLIEDEMSVRLGKTQVNGWSDIQDISVGMSHVVGLRRDGTVIAAGSNHIGQCDIEDWENIVSVTAGNNCTLGITADGELKIAGMIY